MANDRSANLLKLSSMKKMASFTKKSSSNYHVRSVSLPARSHPATIKIEQVLNKLKTREPCFNSSGEAIYNKLYGLVELYERIEELLSLQLSQRALSNHQGDKRVDELLDELLRFIDICSNTRDAVMLIKQAVKDVQSAIRRSKIGFLDGDHQEEVAAYVNTRKKMQKEIAKFLTMLKNEEERVIVVPLLNSDDRFSAMLNVMAEASLMSSFRSLLFSLSAPVMKQRPSRWCLVSKLLKIEGQKNKMSELENVDIELGKLLLNGSCKNIEAVMIDLMTEKRLKALEMCIEGFENVLEDLFRHLICTRVFVLNILSQ